MAINNIEFRLATLEDAPQIQESVQAAFRAEDSRQDWVGHAELSRGFVYPLEAVLPRITNPGSAVLLAHDASSGALLGSVGALLKNGLNRVAMLAVTPGHHRGGLGRQLLAQAEAYAERTWGVKKHALNVMSDRPQLIAWYERRGYVKTGELTPFPNELRRGLDLPEDLCFIELEKEVA